MATKTGEQDSQLIQKIILEYAKKATSSKADAEKLIVGLAQMVQEDGAKLVHFGNTVFLVLVRGKGVIEFHTIAVNENALSLAKNIVALLKYLKAIGVKTAYSYSAESKFDHIAKRTKMLEIKKITMPDGTQANAYVAEF